MLILVQLTKLQQRVTELETDDTKQEREASELKVRELEQKLDLEKSTIKRQEVNIDKYIEWYIKITIIIIIIIRP